MVTGIHHVSFKCSKGEQLKKVIAFYSNTLGIPIIRQWVLTVTILSELCSIRETA